MSKRTGNERVLAALRKYSIQGITRKDFEDAPILDGGAPILRVAARIDDLKKMGHNIIRDGKRDGVAVYKLREGQVSYREFAGEDVAKPSPADLIAQWEEEAA